MNNSMASMLSVSCLNWGVQPNYGAVLYGLCPASSATNDNGTLQSAIFKADGPGYPQFLVMSQSFNYDKLNRLTSASDSGGWSRTFNYDQTGNMWVTNPVGGPWSGSTPTANAFTNNRINGTSYDLSGNQLVVNGDTLAYDAENRQSAATDNTTHVTQKYLYDGAGQRVEKTITGGVTTVYVYDIFALAAEYSTGSNAMTCTTCYPAWDHLGSTRMLMDQNANVIARHDYLPFGEEILANTVGRDSYWGPLDDTVAQKFTGQTRDQETAIDFFNARYFGPALGRFTSPDPANAGADIMNPQSWNAYAYVLGNPLNTTDPSGMCGGIVAGISSDLYHGGGRALLQLAAQYRYDIAFPYAGQSKLAGIFSVFGQSLGFKNSATATAGAMVQDVTAQTAETGGSSFFGPWSGGAVSTRRAGVSPNDSSNYQVHFSPGAALLPTNNPNALVFSGSGVLDSFVNATSSGPLGSADASYATTTGCGHDAACMWNSNQAQINGLLTNGSIPPVQSCPNPTVFLPHGVRIPLKSFFPGGGVGGGGATANSGGPIFQRVYGPDPSGENPGQIVTGWGWLPAGPSRPQPLRPY